MAKVREAVAGAVSETAVSERVGFIRRTYAHLGGAIALFVLLEFALFQMPFVEALAIKMITGYNWAIVLIAFMAVSWIADKWAHSGATTGMQYLGLGLYVLAEAVIFVPMIFLAHKMELRNEVAIIAPAALMTLVVFAGLTGTVFITKKDFSFMRGALMIGGFAAIGAIIYAMAFGASLGLWFSVAMVVLAAGYVLYYTSNVLRHYRTDQHVAAALALFAAIALLFWYILRIAMELARD